MLIHSLHFANVSEENYVIFKNYKFLLPLLFHLNFTVTFVSPSACFLILLLTIQQSPLPFSLLQLERKFTGCGSIG